MTQENIRKTFQSAHSAQDDGGQTPQNQAKRILYVAETPFYEKACIEELQDLGYDVHVAGRDDNHSGIAIDCAMRNLRDPGQKFDLVVSGMFMACGHDNFGIEETRAGWETGLVFAKRLREEGIVVPVLIHELNTGLRDLEGYSHATGVLDLSDGKAQVPVVRREEGYKALIYKVREMIGEPYAPAPAAGCVPGQP